MHQTTTEESFIQYIQNTAGISRQKANTIAACFKQEFIPKQEIIIKESEICDQYYFLESGFIRAYTLDKKGKEISTDFFSSRQMVCDLYSFYGRIPSAENFETATDCNVYCISYADFQTAFHSMPFFREFTRSRLVMAYAGLKQRMLWMLHLSAEERYGRLLSNSPDIFQFVPLKHIASYLGITHTSLSRIRKEFSKKQIEN